MAPITPGQGEPSSGPVVDTPTQWGRNRQRQLADVRRKRSLRMQWAKRNADRQFFQQLVPSGRNPDGTVAFVLKKQKNPFYKAGAAAPAAPASGEEAFPVGDDQAGVDTSLPDVSAAPAANPAIGPTFKGLDLKGVFKAPPRINPSKLLEPATRLLERQRQDADAARAKAATDLQAFYDYLNKTQQATQGGLATSLGGIAADAAKTREESLGRVTDAVTRAVSAAGGNADLLQEAGTTASTDAGALQQQGQDAANTEQQAVQAGLNVRAADQNRVDKALASGMPLTLARAYNQRLRELGDQELGLAGKLADLRFQDAQSLRQFASDQAAQKIAARTSEIELGGKEADRQLKAWIEGEKQRTARLVAGLNNKAKVAIANGKLKQADKDRWIRQQTARLNRQSKEKIAAAQIQAKGASGADDAMTDIDSLAADISSNLSPFGRTSSQQMEDQRRAAVQFVKAAKTRFGGSGATWSNLLNVIDTYFPEFSQNTAEVQKLRAYWGR